MPQGCMGIGVKCNTGCCYTQLQLYCIIPKKALSIEFLQLIEPSFALFSESCRTPGRKTSKALFDHVHRLSVIPIAIYGLPTRSWRIAGRRRRRSSTACTGCARR